MLESYLKALKSHAPLLPIITDLDSALECVRAFSGIVVASLEECRTGMISNVALYQKSEEKKTLSIENIRRFIEDIGHKPYEGKMLYIIESIDTASLEAMNGLLKILEEPPEYAIIILIVTNPEALIDTIRSRTITLFRAYKKRDLSDRLKDALDKYKNHDIAPLISYIYSEKLTGEDALDILIEVSRFADKTLLEKVESAMIHIFSVNESPKNILDRVFLI